MKLKISSRANSLEDALNMTEDEVNEVTQYVEYAFTKFKKPAKMLRYLYEKLGDNDKLMAYALIQWAYTMCYISCRG